MEISRIADKNLPQETNITQNTLDIAKPDRLPVAYDVAFAGQQYDTERSVERTTKITEEQWESVLDYTLRHNKVGPLAFERDFGFDQTTATAAFEELQARNIVTKHYIELPGKSPMRKLVNDPEVYGGYMVLLGYDDDGEVIHKNPGITEPKYDKEITYKPSNSLETFFGKQAQRTADDEEAKQAEREGRRREPVDGKLGRFATALVRLRDTQTGTSVKQYYELNRHRAAHVADVAGGHKKKREEGKSLEIEHNYQQVFDNNGQLDKDGKPVVPDWMDTKKAQVRPWRRSVPKLEITPTQETALQSDDGLTDAERQVDTEIRHMRSRGMTNSTIKVSLLRKYHPSVESTGDLEKAQRATSRLTKMLAKPAVAEVLSEQEVNSLIDEVITEQNLAAQKELEAAARAEAEKPTEQVEGSLISNAKLAAFGLEYLAGKSRKDDDKNKPFKRMSLESFVKAAEKRHFEGDEARELYKLLQNRNIIAKAEVNGEGFKVDDTKLKEITVESLVVTAPEQEPLDEDMIEEATEMISTKQIASVKMLMRNLRIDEANAKRLMAELEHRKVVGPYEKDKPRKILAKHEDDAN